jgi:hypothetical protein
VLRRAGHPSIFWDHYFQDGHKDCIDALVALRKRAGITGGSGIEILCADHDMYVAHINDKCAPPGVPHTFSSCMR